jgi:hypothetical protein
LTEGLDYPKITPSIINKGSGYFFHGKMPGCCLPSLTGATALHFTAGYLKLSLQQEPTPCFAFLGGNSPLPIRSTGCKNQLSIKQA